MPLSIYERSERRLGVWDRGTLVRWRCETITRVATNALCDYFEEKRGVGKMEMGSDPMPITSNAFASEYAMQLLHRYEDPSQGDA